MNLTYSKPYQWQDGDAWLVGRLVLIDIMPAVEAARAAIAKAKGTP